MQRINKKTALQVFASLALAAIVMSVFAAIPQNAEAIITTTVTGGGTGTTGGAIGGGGVATGGAAGAVGRGATANAVIGGLRGGAQMLGTGITIYGLLYLVSTLLSELIAFAASILNAAFISATNASWYYSDAVIAGWELARDFANIWFILVLLIIAVATILRIESYQAKRTLGNLILVAILINFSLPVTRFIIDSANVITFQFVQALCLPTVDPTTKKQTCNVSGSIINGIKLQAILNTAENEVQEGETTNPTAYDTRPDTGTASILAPEAHAQIKEAIQGGIGVAGPVIKKYGTKMLPWVIDIASNITSYFISYKIFSGAVTGEGVFGVAVQPFVKLAITDIALAAAAFVLLSIAVLMMLRTISLLFIIVTAPLGYLFSVFPATAKHGQAWWDHLWKQAFFAPMMTFFLWFSLKFMGEIDAALSAQGYTSMVLTDPSNPRAIFFVVFIIMLFGCLWIAKKMGAIGADLAVKWSEKGGSLLSGFVGGLAARNLVAPIGATALRAGIPQAIGRISPLGGTSALQAAQWLATRGKADKAAADKAALGMTLPPSQRANFFKNLDMASKQAMLEKVKAEDRSAFVASLDPAQRTIAENIMRSAAFTPEERVKFDLDSWKRMTKTDQINTFARTENAELKEQILKSMNDDEKARFLDELEVANPGAKAAAMGILKSKLPPSDLTKLDLANWKRLPEQERQKAFFGMAKELQEQILRGMSDEDKAKFVDKLAGTNRLAAREAEAVINSPRFTADEQKKFKEAQNKITLRKSELGGTLVSDIDAIGNDEEQKEMFKVMSASQRGILLENWTANPAKLRKIQDWTQKMNAEDQEKFYNDTLKRASPKTFVSYVETLPPSMAVSKERIIGMASAPQQANLYDQWKDDGGRLAELQTIASKFSTDAQEKYHEAVAKLFSQKTSGEIKKYYLDLPDEVGIALVSKQKVEDNVDFINSLDETNANDKAVLDKIMAHIESAGKREQHIKKVSPLHKVEYFDHISPTNTVVYEDAVVKEIKATSPKDLTEKITAQNLESATTRNKIFVGISLPQLASLMNTTQKTQIVKDVLTDRGRITDIDELARRFEDQYHNLMMREQVASLRGKQENNALSPIERQFLENLGLRRPR